jgi:hypothetical protein
MPFYISWKTPQFNWTKFQEESNTIKVLILLEIFQLYYRDKEMLPPKGRGKPTENGAFNWLLMVIPRLF